MLKDFPHVQYIGFTKCIECKSIHHFFLYLISVDHVWPCFSANGGLGKAFDELELNRVLCEQNNVRIAGVIINKVIPEKYEQTKHYMQKAMMQAWGIPLLGCIPDRPL